MRYAQYQTSGNFQLIYGFLKPCVIINGLAGANGFNSENSVIYHDRSEYAGAMEKAIFMSENEYSAMQNELKKYVDALYHFSLENLHNLVKRIGDG